MRSATSTSASIRPTATSVVAKLDTRVDKALVVPMGEGDGEPPPDQAAVVDRAGALRGDGLVHRSATRTAAKRLVLGVLIAIFGMAGIIVPFTEPSCRRRRGRAAGESVPTDSSTYVSGGDSALTIRRRGPDLPGATRRSVATNRMCKAEARTQMLGAVLCLVVSGGLPDGAGTDATGVLSARSVGPNPKNRLSCSGKGSP